jgi:hypothetical protein
MEGHDSTSWDQYCLNDKMIVNDTTRSADSIIIKDGMLLQLEDCEPWKRVA